MIPEVSKPVDDLQFPLEYEFRKDPVVEGKGTSYSFRYGVSKTLTPTTTRLRFLLGTALNPYYVYLEYKSKAEMVYDTSSKLYGFTLNVTPRMTYNFNQRFSLDLMYLSGFMISREKPTA